MPAPQMSDDDENGGASSGAPPEPPKIIRVQDLKRMTASELLELAESQGLENIARIKKQDLVFQLRSEEHTSELQSLMRISYAVFCLKKKNNKNNISINRKTAL